MDFGDYGVPMQDPGCDIDNGRGYACVSTGYIWEIALHFSQCYCKPKTAPKSKVFKNKSIQIFQKRELIVNFQKAHFHHKMKAERKE